MSYIWEKQSGETTTWYRRFLVYRDLGRTRSLLAAYKAHRREWLEQRDRDPAEADGLRAASSKWSDRAERHNWQTRAMAWDEHQRRQNLKAIEADGERAAEARRTTIKTLQVMVGQVLLFASQSPEPIDPKSLKELAQAAATIFKESRLEFGDPTEIEQIRIDGALDTGADRALDDRLAVVLERARKRKEQE
mgnify:CR=1 FL=1